MALIQAHPTAQVAIVSRGIAITCLLYCALGFSANPYWRIALHNCPLSVPQIDSRGWHLESIHASWCAHGKESDRVQSDTGDDTAS